MYRSPCSGSIEEAANRQSCAKDLLEINGVFLIGKRSYVKIEAFWRYRLILVASSLQEKCGEVTCLASAVLSHPCQPFGISHSFLSQETLHLGCDRGITLQTGKGRPPGTEFSTSGAGELQMTTRSCCRTGRKYHVSQQQIAPPLSKRALQLTSRSPSLHFLTVLDEAVRKYQNCLKEIAFLS